MDRLPSEKQELLRKRSTERLRLKLAQIGWDEEKVLALERAELLEAAAEVALVTERAATVVKETLPANGNSPGSSAASDAVRLRELKLEERQMVREEKAAERAEKAAEREERARVADREREDKAAERDLELRRMDYEMRKLELTRAEPQRQAGTHRGFRLDERMAGGPPRQDTLAGRTKIFGDAITFYPKCRPKVPKCPNFSKRSKNFS